jgi:hypothetical protein
VTRRIGPIGIIEVEPPTECGLCARVLETRPYGEDGQRICHPCFINGDEKLQATVIANMNRMLRTGGAK